MCNKTPNIFSMVCIPVTALISGWEKNYYIFSMCRYAQSCAFISVIELPRIPAYYPKSSCIMLRNIFQIFLQFNFSHKSVKSQHWIIDVQIILNYHWQNCLFWGNTESLSFDFHHNLTLLFITYNAIQNYCHFRLPGCKSVSSVSYTSSFCLTIMESSSFA